MTQRFGEITEEDVVEFVLDKDYAKLASAIREAVLDLDLQIPVSVIKRQMENALIAAGEEI